MSETPRDIRRTTIRRRIVIDIDDTEREPFTQPDIEWMGEQIEDVLRQKFDVTIDLIQVLAVPSSDRPRGEGK